MSARLSGAKESEAAGGYETLQKRLDAVKAIMEPPVMDVRGKGVEFRSLRSTGLALWWFSGLVRGSEPL